VQLNRAIAIGELHGAGAGIAAIEAVETDRLADYQPYHASRADLLARAGRTRDAVTAYDRAIALTTNPPERAFLIRQREAALERDTQQ
jgi:RNA polymerase sigma-70 factor (ECF subfamily)